MIQLFPAFIWNNTKLWQESLHIFYLWSHLTTVIYSPTISDLQSLLWFHIFFYLIIKVLKNTEVRIILRKPKEQNL